MSRDDNVINSILHQEVNCCWTFPARMSVSDEQALFELELVSPSALVDGRDEHLFYPLFEYFSGHPACILAAPMEFVNERLVRANWELSMGENQHRFDGIAAGEYARAHGDMKANMLNCEQTTATFAGNDGCLEPWAQLDHSLIEIGKQFAGVLVGLQASFEEVHERGNRVRTQIREFFADKFDRGSLDIRAVAIDESIHPAPCERRLRHFLERRLL